MWKICEVYIQKFIGDEWNKNLWYKEIEGIRNKKMIKFYSQGCDMILNESNYIMFSLIFQM